MATTKFSSIIGSAQVVFVRTAPVLFTPPASQGLGTLGTSALYWWQDGEDLMVAGRVLLGTATASIAQIGLPINPLTGTAFTCGTQRGTSIIEYVGDWKFDTTANPGEKSGSVLCQSGRSYISFSTSTAASGLSPSTEQNATSLFGSANLIFINARIPCAQFAGNGYVAQGAGLATSVKPGIVYRSPQTALTVTGTGWTTVRAVAVAYMDNNGVWRMTFNVYGILAASARTTYSVTVTGIVSGPVIQSISSFLIGVGPTAFQAFISNGTAVFQVDHSSASTTGYVFSGDIELASKPSWA